MSALSQSQGRESSSVRPSTLVRSPTSPALSTQHDVTFTAKVPERIDTFEDATVEETGSLFSNSPSESFRNSFDSIDTIVVQHGYDCDFLDNNYQYRYTLFDEDANPIGYALEDHVQYCDNTDDRKRAFDLHIINMIGDTVVNMKRTIKCIERKTYCSYGPFFHLYVQKIKDHVRVRLPWGNSCGYVVQDKKFTGRLTYNVYNNDKLEYVIRGPRFTCNMKNKVFQLKSPTTDKFEGKIARQISQFSNVTRTLHDSYFGLTFPINTPIDGKILLLAAGFLINCMFFADKVDTKLINYDERGKGREKALHQIESRTKIKVPKSPRRLSLIPPKKKSTGSGKRKF